MALAMTTSDLIDNFKLDTEFHQDCTLEITSQRDRGRQMVRAVKTWTKSKDLGCGFFGEVWLEENKSGGTRAIKRVVKNRDINYRKELLAMAELSKVH
jgi:hypothetical protein